MNEPTRPAQGRAGPDPGGAAVLEVDGLSIDLVGSTRQEGLVADVTFNVARGRTLALIGESGCGKTMTALAVLGLLPRGVVVSAGRIAFEGTDLLTLRRSRLREVRGGRIGTIFQDPMSSLNPTMTVGRQIAEVRRIHLKEGAKQARQHATALLRRVGIPKADARADAYPHELSGGMQQRVMIAMAIACNPAMLVADEPTTALDVTIQAEILDLLRELRDTLDMGILLVTHDLGVVADIADEVAVMYAGHLVERAPTPTLFRSPRHPYAAALLGAMPQSSPPRTQLASIPGRVPAAGEFPEGCRFQSRCGFAVPDTCSRPVHFVGTHGDHGTSCTRVTEGSLTLEDRV